MLGRLRKSMRPLLRGASGSDDVLGLQSSAKRAETIADEAAAAAASSSAAPADTTSRGWMDKVRCVGRNGAWLCSIPVFALCKCTPLL